MIRTREEYEADVRDGWNPLADTHCTMDHGLRLEIQRELFPSNEAFYRWCWNNYPHYCMECMRRLPEYSAVYVSHILTRGAHPDMAHDPRNVRILCARHHEQYEHRPTRRSMRIYEETERIADSLRKEYSKSY